MVRVCAAIFCGLACALLYRVECAPPDPLVTFLNGQVQYYNIFYSALADQGLGHLVATFNTNYVTYEMLPELTDSDLRELGVVQVGWRLILRRAIARLDRNQDQHQDQDQDNNTGNQIHNQEDLNQENHPETANQANNGNIIEEAPNNEETPNNEDNEVTFYLISKATGSVTDDFFDGVYKFSRGE